MDLVIPKYKVGSLVRVVCEEDEHILAFLVSNKDAGGNFRERKFIYPVNGDILMYVGPGTGVFSIENEQGTSTTRVDYHRFLYNEQLIDIIEGFLGVDVDGLEPVEEV